MKTYQKLTSLVAATAIVACSSQAPQQLNKNQNKNALNGAVNGAYDQTGVAGTQNRAPILQPISPIAVNAGSTFNVNLVATDPENAIVRYIVTCPAELGGTQNGPKGSFTMTSSRELGNQDAQCGAMVIDNFGLQGKQTFVVNVKSSGSTKKAPAIDVKGQLMSIAFPAAMKALKGYLDKKPAAPGSSGASSALKFGGSSSGGSSGSSGSTGGSTGISPTTGIPNSDWSKNLNWDQFISGASQNPLANGSNFEALATTDLGTTYYTFGSPGSEDSIDWNKLASGSDYTQYFSNSGSGNSEGASGFTFKDIWNSEGLSFGDTGVKFDQQLFDSSQSTYNNYFDPNMKFEYTPYVLGR
jgi:hypothetical protein